MFFGILYIYIIISRSPRTLYTLISVCPPHSYALSYFPDILISICLLLYLCLFVLISHMLCCIYDQYFILSIHNIILHFTSSTYGFGSSILSPRLQYSSQDLASLSTLIGDALYGYSLSWHLYAHAGSNALLLVLLLCLSGPGAGSLKHKSFIAILLRALLDVDLQI